MNTKTLIGIVCLILLIAFGTVLLRGSTLGPNTPNRGMMTNLTSSKQPVKDYIRLVNVNSAFYKELEQKGPYTLFVPTDTTFASYPQDMVANLYKTDYQNSWVRTNFLANTLVIGTYPESGLRDGMQLTTVQGKRITITKKGNDWYIDGTIKIDNNAIQSKNGIIYMIDGIIPPKPY